MQLRLRPLLFRAAGIALQIYQHRAESFRYTCRCVLNRANLPAILSRFRPMMMARNEKNAGMMQFSFHHHNAQRCACNLLLFSSLLLALFPPRPCGFTSAGAALRRGKLARRRSAAFATKCFGSAVPHATEN